MRVLALVVSLLAVTSFAKPVEGLSKSYRTKVAPSLRGAKHSTKLAVPKHHVVQAPRSHHRG
jgi:hypothetical protein